MKPQYVAFVGIVSLSALLAVTVSMMSLQAETTIARTREYQARVLAEASARHKSPPIAFRLLQTQ